MRDRCFAREIRFLALAAGLLIVPACSSDNSNGNVLNPPGVTTFLLQYDGPRDASPDLTGNRTYEAAARFTTTETAPVAGGKLTEVQFYIQTVPDTCRVRIYGAGTATTPGAILYSADVTPIGASWNTHVLTSDVTVTANDLWISIEFRDTLTQPTIGCDPGPAAPNGRWLYDSSSGSWAPFVVDVNWNVRGVVEVAI